MRFVYRVVEVVRINLEERRREGQWDWPGPRIPGFDRGQVPLQSCLVTYVKAAY
jgi:hypothetical protein